VRSLYNIFSEMQTSFEGQLKNSLDVIIKQQINKLPSYEFLSVASKFIEEFMDRNLDMKLDDNVRWAIAVKIIIRILETCPQDCIVELVVQWNQKFLDSLVHSNFSDFESDPGEYYRLVREKTYIM